MTTAKINRRTQLASVFALLIGLCGGYAGYALNPGSAAGPSAQPEFGAYPPPPTWKTAMPAVRIARGDRTLWPNQPTEATHWTIDDIRAAHETLAAAERSGQTMDPNDALHDFPYWTRTHSMFIRHVPRNAVSDNGEGNPAEQHLGYAQFIVVMGGAGEIRAGGQIENATTLVDDGQQIPGELRGSAITGGDRFEVGPGDWVSIPANTPTQVTTNVDGGLTYMVMKVNAMLYPWEFIR